jgi:hypothetical protein
MYPDLFGEIQKGLCFAFFQPRSKIGSRAIKKLTGSENFDFTLMELGDFKKEKRFLFQAYGLQIQM